MATKVFISHSMKNIELVNQAKAMLEQKGLNAYVAVSEPEPGEKLDDKIVNHIKSSSFFLLLYTKDAETSPWVNSELGIAVSMNKKIIPIIEEGVQLPSIISGIEYVKMDSINPGTCIQGVCDYLSGLMASKDETKIIVASILILLGVVVLASILSE
ncbi:MAG: toll/interleukin-1 receptor domain-containing protein [Candidatus Hodarchaeales archaeon]